MSEDRKSFWGELKERRVVRVGIVYIVVAWAVLQVAETITGILSVPDWAPQLVLMLLTLGFPVALVFAWAFQMTPAGMKRAEPIPKGPGSRLPFVAGLAVGILSVSGVAFIFFGAEPASDPGTRELDPNSVAVLPFRASTPEDLSYLGSGVMDLLAARLDGEVGPRSLDPVDLRVRERPEVPHGDPDPLFHVIRRHRSALTDEAVSGSFHTRWRSTESRCFPGSRCSWP